jgi:hypothetical protein
LGVEAEVEGVDLDDRSYGLFQAYCSGWAGAVRWEQGDALEWLARRPDRFDVVIDDLSVPREGDVVKPDISWGPLPVVARASLRPGGRAILNLLPARSRGWNPELLQVRRGFAQVRVIELEEYVNRLLVAGEGLPTPRVLGGRLRGILRTIRSRQADRISVKDGSV